MPDGVTALRLRAAASRWFSVLVVAGIVLAAVGVGLTYTTHVDPGTTTETVTRTVVPIDGELSHSATVTRPNAVYTTGTTLEEQSTYFTGVSPVLNATYALSYGGAADSADIAVDVAVVTRSTPEGGEGTLWVDRRPLTAERATGVEPGETVTTAVAVNASAVYDRVAEIQSDLGASPGSVDSEVLFEVTVVAVVDGEEVQRSYIARLPFTPTAETYAVDAPTGVSDAIEEAETVTREQSYGPLRSVGAPIAGAVGLAGLGALGLARRRDELGLSDSERDYLAYRDDREAFDEWITEIRLPESVRNRPEATAGSLADLVDFAIDADTGVVRSPDDDGYYVLGDELLYVYHPPAIEAPDEEATAFERPEIVRTGGYDDGDAREVTNGREGESEDAVGDGEPESVFDDARSDEGDGADREPAPNDGDDASRRADDGGSADDGPSTP